MGAFVIRNFLFVLVIAMLVIGHMAGPNQMVDTANAVTHARPAGFFLGLWHGIICVISFVLSLFTDDVSIYEVHNTGGRYDCGFLIGAGIFAHRAFGTKRR